MDILDIIQWVLIIWLVLREYYTRKGVTKVVRNFNRRLMRLESRKVRDGK